MTDKEIFWESYKIIRDVCETDGQCPNCPLYESCKSCDEMPHRIIKNFYFDLYVKPLSESE